MKYEIVIGLEVHVQLKTKSKAFCSCSTEFGQEPNSQTCPVCLGFPGSLPVLNTAALDYAIKTGLALNCQVQEFTKFDRKHYYYPDLPKNYQISQYDLPVCKTGYLDIEIDEVSKRIGITRAHLEEDAGKLIHKDQNSLVDLNRTGIPLLEIVSEPDMNSPQEAYEYLSGLKAIVQYVGVSDCDMEKGTLRCDANISVRIKGEKILGTKTELKNMNSFKGVKDALEYEAKRQIAQLEAGNKIIQETMLWDTKELKTVVMRTKEEAKDYRYFPEPDLPPFIITQAKIEEARKTLPELPKEKTLRFCKEYGINNVDSAIITSDRNNADYAEACFKAYPNKEKKNVANWLIGPLMSEANNRNLKISELKVEPPDLVQLLSYLDKEAISNLNAKVVLKEMIDSGLKADQIIKNKNLIQISDSGELDSSAEAVIADNPKSVADFKAGKANAVMFLVGQMMKKTAGKANPKVVQEILKDKLSKL